MSALSEARNTAELHIGAIHYNFERVVNDGSTVYAGAIAAQNSSWLTGTVWEGGLTREEYEAGKK